MGTRGEDIDAAPRLSEDYRVGVIESWNLSNVEYFEALLRPAREALLNCATADEQGVLMKRFSRGQQMLLHMDAFQGQIDNGGFEQYFSNWSGAYTAEDMEFLQLISAEKYAELLEEALGVFPERNPPQDQRVRRQIIDETNDDNAQTLERLSLEFYELHKTDANLIAHCREYVDSHASEFFRE